MARLVPEDLHAPLGVATLDAEHLTLLEPHEARVRHVERQRDAGDAVGRVPVVGEPEVRAEPEPARLQLVAELLDARFERAARDRDPEVAEPEAQELLVVPVRPDGLGAFVAHPESDVCYTRLP
jgi:hypothetical protein